MTKIKYALIMATGRGARMMALTAVVSKPMAPYLGSTLISDGIRKIQPDIKYIHVIVGYNGPQLAEYVVEPGVHRPKPAQILKHLSRGAGARADNRSRREASLSGRRLANGAGGSRLADLQDGRANQR